jgi:hypothetical protein
MCAELLKGPCILYYIYHLWMDISRQARGFVTRPSAKRAHELLNFSRNQPTTMTGLLTWHCYLKGHLFKWGW